MEIWLNEDFLKAFYEILVDIYRNTDYPITVGYNEGMISVCIERPLTDIYNIIPFPHLLHRAAVMMETITRFHPFADGNKRVGLLATFYLLYWNGYDLTIPNDADQFTVEIAQGHKNLNDILSWLVANSKREVFGILRNLFCSFLSIVGDDPIANRLAALFIPLLVPLYPFEFFRGKIQRSTHAKTKKADDSIVPPSS
jgi:death-on-curing protein